MYATYFGLAERPFSLAPDPRYFYLGDAHREALAHLLYGIGEGGSFVVLTGEVGTGKTTVCRALLEQLPPDVDIAMIFNPRLTSVELLATVCDELGVTYPRGTGSLKVLVDALSHALLDAHGRGRRTVLIIDEAQSLAPEVLEEIRLLTNLETTREKLLQVILIGQPELARLLARQELRHARVRLASDGGRGPEANDLLDARRAPRPSLLARRPSLAQHHLRSRLARGLRDRAGACHGGDRAPRGARGARPVVRPSPLDRGDGAGDSARRRRRDARAARPDGHSSPPSPGARQGRSTLDAGPGDHAGRRGNGRRAAAPRADARRDPEGPSPNHRPD